jgi:hypothetical protein
VKNATIYGNIEDILYLMEIIIQLDIALNVIPMKIMLYNEDWGRDD